MLGYTVCAIKSALVRRWRRDLVTQTLIMSCCHQPRGKTLEHSTTKAWMTARYCVQRRTSSFVDPCDPCDVDKYFRSWEEREEEYLTMDVVIYLKTALMELAADNRPSKVILNHPGYLSLRQYIIDDAKNQATKNIAFVLWLCARYKLKDKELHQAMIDELDQRNPELLSDRQLGLVVWSLTVLGYYQDSWSLIEACVDETIKRMNEGALRDHYTVSQLCWSFVNAERWPKQFTAPLSKYVSKYMRDFEPHTLTTITWALQKCGHGDLAQLTKHTQVARSNFSESNIRSHSMMLWSLGNAKHFDQPYFERLTEDILDGKVHGEMDALMLSVVLWSFSRVGYHHYDLLEQLAAIALDRIDEFSFRQLSRLAHSLCHLNHIPKELLGEVAKRVCAKFTGRKGFEEAYPAMETMYACLVCDFYPPELLSLIVEVLNDGELQRGKESTAVQSLIECNQILGIR